MPTEVTQRDRLVHGVYAEDVVYLRGLGMIVAPFQGGYRVDNEVFEKPALQVFAREQRQKRGQKHQPARAAIVPQRDKRAALTAAIEGGATIGQAARAAGASKSTAFAVAQVATPAELLCKCGRPNSHQGRCWARRGDLPEQARVAGHGADRLEARVGQLERQVKGLLRILANGMKADRLLHEERAQTFLKREAEMAQI